MTREGSRFGNSGRACLWTAAACAGVSVGAACCAPAWVSLAYRLAVFACLAPALGCLALVLIHRITGGQWASGLAPFLCAGAGMVPWIWLFALPLLFLPPGLGGRHLANAAILSYDGRWMVGSRALLYAFLFFGLRWAVAGDMGRDREPFRNSRPWAGPVGLIVLFFLATFVADDWLESLEPDWHSTAFTVIWLAGSVVFGLALSLLLGLRGGAAPGTSGVSGRALGLDWGNLMLATMVFWCYVSYAQFLIIWAGNLPEEIPWYLHREKGVWEGVVPCMAVFGFAIPFLMLLSRRLKRTVRGLACAAALLVATQVAYTAWVILPAGGIPPLCGWVLAASLLVAAGALFLNRLAAAAARPMKGAR